MGITMFRQRDKNKMKQNLPKSAVTLNQIHIWQNENIFVKFYFSEIYLRQAQFMWELVGAEPPEG